MAKRDTLSGSFLVQLFNERYAEIAPECLTCTRAAKILAMRQRIHQALEDNDREFLRWLKRRERALIRAAVAGKTPSES